MLNAKQKRSFHLFQHLNSFEIPKREKASPLLRTRNDNSISLPCLLVMTLPFLLTACPERVKMDPEKSKLDFSLTAVQLWTDYKDQKSGDEKYLMKIVEVTGTIEKTGTNVIQIPYVILQTGDPAGGVQCFFGKNYFQKASELKIGQTVKLRGRCIGKVIHVGLDDCIIPSP